MVNNLIHGADGSRGNLAKIMLILAFLFAPSISFSQIYKCIGADGKASFSANPVCDTAQPYSKKRADPVRKLNLGSVAKIHPDELLKLRFEKISLSGLVELIGDFSGIPFVILDVPETPINIDQPSAPWLPVLEKIIDQNGLEYRQAYDVVYLYKTGGQGQLIVNTPDLLRWYQTQRTWDVVLENEAKLVRVGDPKQGSSQWFAKLLSNVRRDLGEPSHGNAAEYVVTKESFDAGGTGTTVVNKGIYAEYEKREAERQAQGSAGPQAILLRDARQEAAERQAERQAAFRAERSASTIKCVTAGPLTTCR